MSTHAIVRTVARAVLGSALTLGLAPTACSSPTQEPRVGPEACVVAQGDGFAIRMADVDAMRQQLVPPPPRDDAVRMTVDAWLAEWLATGRLGDATPRARRGHHHELVNLELEDRRREIRRAATAVHLRLGPCHPGQHDRSPGADDDG